MRKYFMNAAIDDQFKSTCTVDVYFSPDGCTTAAIVNYLNSAESEIRNIK
jgi:hypothetical protein